MPDLQDLLHHHVTRLNAGVRSGDFAPMVAGFHDDAELRFEAIPVGPFLGRVAIAEAYASQPPDDEIDVLNVVTDGDTVVTPYAWRSAPGTHAGTLRVTFHDGMIVRLVVVYCAPR